MSSIYELGYDAAMMSFRPLNITDPIWKQGYEDGQGDLELMTFQEAGLALYEAKKRYNWRKSQQAKFE